MAVVNNTLQLNDRMTPVLRSITRALQTTLNAMSSVDRVAQTEFRAAERAIRQASAATEDFANNLNSGGNSLSASAGNAGGAIDGLIGRIGGLVGAYVSLQGAMKLINNADTYIGNTARLDLMNDGLQTTEELQKKIYEASQRSLTNYNDMTNAVAKLGITARHSFSSNDEMIAFTETLNKQFKIAGTGAQEQSAAMYQLTQAMASGRLQGDEFRSIMENAPLLAATIADHMGLTFGQLREASSEGKITAGIIKQALLSTAEETNKRFMNMPMTFGDLWTQVVNRVNRGLEPLYIRLRQMWNNPEMQTFLTQMVNGFVAGINTAITLFNVLAGISSFVYDNWGQIAPLIYGIIGALGAYKLALMVVNGINAAAAFAEAAKGAALALSTGSTFAATAAQWGFNAALYACPITWIIAGIILIVAAIYGLVAAFNKVAGTSYSVTGAIVGYIAASAAGVWNILLGLGEIIFSLIQNIWNGWANFANFFANVFHSPISSILKAFSGMANGVLNVIKGIASAIDAVFGSNLADSVKGWQSGLDSLTNKAIEKYAGDEKYEEKVKTFNSSLQDMGAKRVDQMDAYNAGYSWTKGKVQDVKDAFKVGDKSYDTMGGFDYEKMMADANKNLGATAANTGKLAEGVKLADEDIELLKETARISFVNRFTTMTPQITATFGDVHETADVKGIMGQIEKSVQDALESSLTT